MGGPRDTLPSRNTAWAAPQGAAPLVPQLTSQLVSPACLLVLHPSPTLVLALRSPEAALHGPVSPWFSAALPEMSSGTWVLPQDPCSVYQGVSGSLPGSG